MQKEQSTPAFFYNRDSDKVDLGLQGRMSTSVANHIAAQNGAITR